MPDAGPIADLAEWIATTWLAHLIGGHMWAIPTIQSFHYMSLAILFASAAVVDLRLLGLISQRQTVSSLTRRLVPGIWIGLAGAVITGLLLLIAEPVRSMTTWEFQSKMAMLVVVVVLTVAMKRTVLAHAAEWDGAAALPVNARAMAVASPALWMLIILAGRWIAYHA
jgi:hypothetical protein